MTQEQLAEMLSISPQAVSRWETDMAMPDISLLPMLSNIFDVTSDELLGIDIERKNEKIDELLESAKEVTRNGDFVKELEILRGAYRQYPRSYKIMVRLANSIVCVNSRQGIKDYDEVFELCNKILAGCTDDMIRYRALVTLGTAYSYAGKEDERCLTVEKMPPFEFCRENFMLYRTPFNDSGLAWRQEYLSDLMGEVMTLMRMIAMHTHDDGSCVYSTEERIAILKQTVALADLMYPDGDYQTKAQGIDIACSYLVNIYLSMNDTDNAFYWLDRLCDYVIHSDTYDFDAPHTAPVFRGYSDGGWIRENGNSRSADYLRGISEDKVFDKIRNDPRFEAILDRLRETVGKIE